MNIENIFLKQRLNSIFTYWEKHVDKMPNKLIIPLQHSLDFTPYFSFMFRDKYRITLQLIMSAMKSFSSFLIYSAILQRDEPFGNTTDSRFLIHSFKLLNTTNKITLDLNPQHERTFLPSEFIGELHMYADTFEQGGAHQQVLHNGKLISREHTE
jgi:hypothetical protein